MPSRIIKDAETDAVPTLVFSGDLLEIDSPGSLQTPEIIALNGAVFSMTAGATLTGTGVADPSGGLDALSLNGLATIDGAVVNASAGVVAIGNSGNTPPSATGVLTVSNGATVTAAATAIGNWNTGTADVGSLLLLGAGTSWRDTGDPSTVVGYGAMEVGALGTGHLAIESGAKASETAYAVIGGGSGANGDATVDGAGSAWTIGTHLRIGAFGTGTLTVSNNGSVSVGDYAALGYYQSGSGSVTIDSNATLSVAGSLFVGNDGTGTLLIKNLGTVSAAEVDISHDIGSSGTVTVDGGTLTATGTLAVGIGGSGTLGISVNGTVTANLLEVAASADGGTAAKPSIITIDGKGSALNVATNTFIGSANPTPDAPPDINGQFGRWTYSPGGFGRILVKNGGYLSIGQSLGLQEADDPTAPESLWVQSGGSAEIGGNSGPTPDRLTVDSGAVLEGHGKVVVADVPLGGTTLVNQSLVNNGVLLAQYGTLTITANVTGTGTLQIDQDAAADIYGAFTGSVEFNGGYDTTLRLEQPNPNDFKGTIGNLQIGDVISLKAAFPATLSHAEINGSSLVLTFQDNTSWTYNLSGDYSDDTFAIHDRTVGGTPYKELVLQPANPKIGTEFSGQPTDGASPYVDSLVWGWAEWLPQKGPITYWFGGPDDVKAAVLAHGESTDLAPDTVVDAWTPAEEAPFLSAINTYQSVSDLTFEEADSPSAADVIWWLKSGLSDATLAGIAEGPAYVPGGPIWQFFLDSPLKDPQQVDFGGFGQQLATHEIGHLLGLADVTPSPRNAPGGFEHDATPFPSPTQDQTVFTVMSYHHGWNGPGLPYPLTDPIDWGTQGGLGALDIAAIQEMYGTNTATGAGDTHYPLPEENQPGTGWQAIWDPNGFNTISNEVDPKPCHIDLRAAPLIGPDAGGYPSYVQGVQGGFTIAKGSEVDGAIGGFGNDWIHTNSGPDDIDGGGGSDIVVFSDVRGAYTLSRSGSTVTATLGPVTDTLKDIFALSFADGVVLTTSIPCFAEGTLIATEQGEIAVEALQPGDRVLALAGETCTPVPAIWIGRRRIDLVRHPAPELVQPIRIRRDAIAPGQPARDLLLSPDHAIFIDGGLIPARLLVNGGGIVQEHAWRGVTYYHVELARHAVILADGLPVESYLDTGNRGAFENGDAPVMLHPDFFPVSREDGGCAPFVATPTRVRPVWERLARRGTEIGYPPVLPEATHDPALALWVGGRVLRPVSASDDRYVFVLPRDTRAARLVSRSARPCETRPWADDRRRLGVRIGRITLRDTATLTEVPLDSPALGEGWWPIEADGRRPARWTDGNASLVSPSGSVLTLWLTGSTTYPARTRQSPAPFARGGWATPPPLAGGGRAEGYRGSA